MLSKLLDALVGPFLPYVATAATTALIALALALSVQTHRLESAQASVATMEQADQDRATAAAVQALHDAKNKERTDNENATRTAALNRELARLRARPEFVAPEAPPASGCPATQVCFDGAEFQRAYRDLAREVREVAGQCTKVGIDLDSAKDWANGD